MPIECLSVGLLVADHLCVPIDHAPAAGELVLTDALQLKIGGCAANAAMDLARVGVEVSIVGCVGDDVFGQFIVDTLFDAGVETGSIRRLSDVGTSGTLIVNVEGEDRRFVHAIGANARIAAEDITPERLRQTKVLYVGGFGIMPGMRPDALAQVFRSARAAGVRTVLDVVLPGPGDHWSALNKLLPETDVFLPNDDEAKLITGLDDARAQAQRFRAAGAKTVVITRGEHGTVLVSDRERFEARPFPTTYVGGTGAGDAFDAGFITGMLSGADDRGCVAWGSALGASCVRSISATDSVFTRPEAEAFLREHPLIVETW